MKKAIIHDWLDKYGGAERVLTAICEIYDFDYYYAYVNNMTDRDLEKAFGDKKIVISESSFLKRFRKFFRYMMPFFPYVIKSFNKQTKSNKVDWVISSSWAMSKGYRIGDEVHFCYLQARNFKYIWEEADLYFKGPFRFFSFLKPSIQKFDIESAQQPDYLIANSKFVQNWVREKYDRECVVIYPPVDVDDFYISEEKEDYYITIGRLEPYKRFDVIVEAFANNGKPLIVVGDGTQLEALKDMATPNIIFVGYKTKDEIIALLSKAKAFVFAGVEDFGIVLVESLASGVPVIAFEGGASKEIIDESNGLLYPVQSAQSLNEYILDFESLHFDSLVIRASSMKFAKERFKIQLQDFIKERIEG